jgi:hypothetical protein
MAVAKTKHKATLHHEASIASSIPAAQPFRGPKTHGIPYGGLRVKHLVYDKRTVRALCSLNRNSSMFSRIMPIITNAVNVLGNVLSIWGSGS